MSRTLHGSVVTGVAGSSVMVAELASFAFPSGTLRTTTAPRDIVWSGDTYTANALLGRFSGVQETSDFKPRRVTFNLPGQFAAALTAVRDDAYHFAVVNLYFCLIDATTYALIGDPVALATDLQMSTAVISATKDSLTIDLSTEGPEVLAMRDSANLASHVAQLRRYAGDNGMLNVEKIGTYELTWGGEVSIAGRGAGGNDYIRGGFDNNTARP